MDELHQLTLADLTALVGALRSGRLLAPYSAVAMHRFCPTSHATVLASRLQQLHEDGMQPRHLALLVETIARSRSVLSKQADLVELVWTGPETSGITNRDTGVVVRDLFGTAQSEVLVAGFAVHKGRSIFQRLAERMEEIPSLRVRLFLDVQRHPTDTSMTSEVLRRFLHRFRTKEWSGPKLPELHYDPRSLDEETKKRSSMHAKCIVVDRRVSFVSSANFTEAAQMRNIEVGALIRSERFSAQLAGHFETLAEAGELPSFAVGSS